MRFLLLISLLCFFVPQAASAQEDDRGFVTRTIEDALSGEGRVVKIEGFKGALSSESSFDRMTIADNNGVWLTLDRVSLIWSRSALLRGRLQVNKLTAESLEVLRLPEAPQAETLPAAEAGEFSFSLPELPVAINVESFAVGTIDLGEPVIGVPVQATVNAGARLDDDGLNLNLSVIRTDSVVGAFVIRAAVERETEVIAIDVRLDETQGGIAARLLNIPDQPSVRLTIAGEGVLDDFEAEIDLRTEGEQRLAGEVSLLSLDTTTGDQGVDRRVRADLGGDITALVLPEYRDFFGTDVKLELESVLQASGGVDIQSLRVGAEALELAGAVRLNEENWPTFIDVTGEISQGGEPVVLPGADGELAISSLSLDVDYDAAQDDALDGVFELVDLTYPDLEVGRLRIDLEGALRGDVDASERFAAQIDFGVDGIGLADDALAQAVGRDLKGGVNATYVEGQPFRISDLRVEGSDYSLDGQAEIESFDRGFPTRLELSASAQDLARFSLISGQSLSGSAAFSVTGDVTPLAGSFNLQIAGETQEIALQIPQADALLAGETVLSLAAIRDTSGTFVRDLKLGNDAMDVSAEAALQSRDSQVEALIEVFEIGRVLPQYSGAVTASAVARQGLQGWEVDASVDAPYDTALGIAGLATGPNTDIAFDLSVPEVQSYAPGIEGTLTANGRLKKAASGYEVSFDAIGPYAASAKVAGLATGPEADLNFELAVPDLKALAPGVEGALGVAGNVRQSDGEYLVDVSVDGPYSAEGTATGLVTGPDADIRFDVMLPEIRELVPSIEGALSAGGNVRQSPEGYLVDIKADGPYDAVLAMAGLATGPEADLRFDLSVPEVQPLVPSVQGALRAGGNVRQADSGYEVDVNAAGPYQATARIIGLATGPEADIRFNLEMPDVQPVVPAVQGPLRAEGRVQQADTGYSVDVTAGGPYASVAKVAGLATGPDADIQFDLNVPDLQSIAPRLTGPLDVSGRVEQSTDGYLVDIDATGPNDGVVAIEGLATGPNTALNFSAAISDMSVLVPDIGGPLSADGSLARRGERYDVASEIKGPSGLTGSLQGSLAADASNVDVAANGVAPLSLTGPFLTPRSLLGDLNFDLAIRGTPSLEAVTGQLKASNARFTDPNLRVGLTDMDATVQLGQGVANIDLDANIVAGGTAEVDGTVNLTSLAADLRAALRKAVLADPRIFTATLNADVGLSGPLNGGASINGEINLEEVNVSVPGAGVTSVGAIPDIRHVGSSVSAQATRDRAGIKNPDEIAAEKKKAGPAFPLKVLISAPSRIFVRGRGLNAELGGELEITGTTGAPVSAGEFELLRGRFDIIGKRFNLDEGLVQFQGSATPYLRFVTTTEIPDGTASIIVEGLATEPEITFTSSPEAPEDEIISLIIFGRYVSELSAFQALQLANGIAEISGRKGVGIIGSLRQGAGLDDLDVTTTESGETKLSVGKYLTDDIYTDVTTGAETGTNISLNIDLTDDLTGKATMGAEGDSSLGLFFQRDY